MKACFVIIPTFDVPWRPDVSTDVHERVKESSNQRSPNAPQWMRPSRRVRNKGEPLCVSSPVRLI
jgi:hypothetical protein